LKRRTELLILAGGFGTRLRSVVSEVPKPLAPVVGKPYLHYLIESWVEQGVTHLTFLLHHRAELVEAFLKLHYNEIHSKDFEVRTLVEYQPLGTGGAVANAVEKLRLTESFLVTNADTWLGSGIEQLWEIGPPAMCIVDVENTERYGRVRMKEGQVLAFDEKQSSAGAGGINAGLYHLHPKLFHDWNGQPFSLERQLFPKLASSGDLKAVLLETNFIDIGIPEDYFRFCRWIESGKTGPL
jgi:NDP-sugar pyrophosphorylase family protein